MTTMHAPTRGHLGFADAAATLFVAASVVVFGLWNAGTAFGGTSVRVIGAVVFGLGMASCYANQAAMVDVYGVGGPRRARKSYVVTASAVGAVALVAGIVMLVTASETMLVTLVAAMVVLWAMTIYRHAFMRELQ